jgi:hypothetical protein
MTYPTRVRKILAIFLFESTLLVHPHIAAVAGVELMTLIPAHLRTVVSQDGAAILDVSRNRIVTLNSTGGFVWERLQKGSSPQQIVDELVKESSGDASVVELGVFRFLERLRSECLLLL